MKRVARGGGEACRNAAYRASHQADCHCWDYFDRGYRFDERCVLAAEENGIVAMHEYEILAHRIIADHIDERPIFERDFYTRWASQPFNLRQQPGPNYLRPSGEFALVNRGRTNQLVYSSDIDGFDPCARMHLAQVQVPRLSEPRQACTGDCSHRAYRPNPHPTLLRGSFLSSDANASWHESATVFEAGESVFLTLQWFEQAEDDPSTMAARRFHHGVRACVFDSNGTRIWTGGTASGEVASRRMEFPLPANSPEGTYTVQACTVGSLSATAENFAGRSCLRPILEYTFSVTEQPMSSGQ
jgi:hypothetical protein